MSNVTEQSAASRAGWETSPERPQPWPRILALSGGVWPRVGLLFGGLCLVKILMLLVLGKSVYEAHWRVANLVLIGWESQVAFYLFAALAVANIWMLGERCRGQGSKAVRAANACVLVLGAAFILMSFHTGRWNYLSAVVGHTLQWQDLRWYLYMDLVFRPPYLAGWLLGYGAVYYALWRTGREHLVLHVTALCAGGYIVLCLRHLLPYGDALIVADAVGLACLLAGRGTHRRLNLAVGSAWLIGVGFVLLIFSKSGGGFDVRQMKQEFLVLSCATAVLVAGVSLWALWRGVFRSWSWMLPFAFAAILLLVNINYNSAANYQNLLCMGLTVPHYFLGELAVALLLLAVATGYRWWRPSGSLRWLDITNVILIAWALIDLRLSQIMEVRLDWSLLSLAYGETPTMMWRMARPYLPAVTVAVLFLTLIYAGLLRCIPKYLRWRKPSVPALAGSARFGLLLFVLLGLAGKWVMERDKAEGQAVLLMVESSPLWQRTATPVLPQPEFEAKARRLGMPQLLAAPSPAPGSAAPRDWNVVFVMLESACNKHLSLFGCTNQTQPLLSRYADRMELFPNFFCSFAGSISARFAAFAGLYPAMDYKAFTLRRVPVKSLFELLNENGYSCSMFYSSHFEYTGFKDFLRGRGLAEMYDASSMPGPRKTEAVSWGLREEETLAAMQRQIRKYAAEKKRFFMTYIPAAPHMPYDGTPRQFRKFVQSEIGDFTPAYLNELLYMDWVVTSVLDELRDAGLLDSTLVVITGDHGEMLGDNGGPTGHGWAVTPELANVPLIVMDPARRGCGTNYTIGSHVDVLPTVLDLLHLPVPDGQLYQGNSLYSAEAQANRTIYLSSFREYGIITGGEFIWGERNTGTRTAAERRKVYRMANEGSRTVFAETNSMPGMDVMMSEFDKFQQNLLRHYSQYSQQALSGMPMPAVGGR